MSGRTRRDELERVLTTHGAAVSRVLRSYARTAAEREDLQQDVAVAVMRALDSFRNECSERSFVLRIAHNQALTYVARRRRRTDTEELSVEPPALDPDPEILAGLNERMRAVFRAIHRLPLGARQVLVLSLEGLSQDDIAEVMGITANNVAVRLSRARADLRRHMGEEP